MTRVRVGLAGPLLLGAAAILFQALPVMAQDNASSGGPIVFHQLQHDVSLPLWMMAKAPKRGGEEVNILIPENRGETSVVAAPIVKDPVGDDPVAAGAPLVSTQDLLNFDGIAQSQSICNCAPPDT